MPGRSSIAVLTGAILALSAGPAWAAPASITTTFDNRFSAPSFDHDPGTTATITWTGGGPHSVRSYATDSLGQPLFSSENVFLVVPASAPVNGTASLVPGEYAFFCTVHGSSMSSNLRVLGTPPPPGITSPDQIYSALAAPRRKKCKKGKKLRRGKCVKRKKKRKK